MNILSFSISVSATTGKGGVEKVVTLLANQMVERGHRFVIFDPVGESPAFHLDKRVIYEKCPWLSSSLVESQQKSVSRFDPDVIFVPQGFCLAEVLRIAAPMGIPVIYSEHGSPFYLRKEMSEWYSGARRHIGKLADGLHFLFPDYAETFDGYTRAKKFIIGNTTMIPDQYPEKERKEHKRIIFLGRYMDNKDPLILQRAFNLISRDFPQWELCFFGAEPYWREDKTLNIMKEIEQERVFIKEETEQVDEELLNSDILCMPSKYEAFPLVLLEALAMGLPCVGFKDCTGVNRLIQNEINGLLVKERSAEALSEALKILMSDDTLREQYGKNGYDFVKKNYSPTIIAEQYEAMFAEVAKAKNSTAAQTYLEYYDGDLPTSLSKTPYQDLKQNKWYHFGQLFRKWKFLKIMGWISRKLKIYPLLKPIKNLLGNLWK